MRQEHDGLGTMELPDEAYWGIVSERNKEAFDVGPLTLDDYALWIPKKQNTSRKPLGKSSRGN